MLLINGSEGISSGFAQKILPRNPAEILKYLKYYLKKPDAVVKPFKNLPYFEGFKGTIKEDPETGAVIVQGVVKKIKQNLVKITELPIGYNLKSYIKVLDKLEDQGKIQTYKDLSNKSFEIDVTIPTKVLKSIKDLVTYLKLEKRTQENWTVMSEQNTVLQLDGPDDVMQRYMKVKLDYLQKRKDNLITNMTQDIRIMVSKYVFIQSIVNDELVISNKPMKEIEHKLKLIDKIIEIDDTYEYLLRMNIGSLTKERMEKLLEQIKNTKADLDKLKKQTPQEMWLEDLENL
jgi:DNA topoisomerase-2